MYILCLAISEPVSSSIFLCKFFFPLTSSMSFRTPFVALSEGRDKESLIRFVIKIRGSFCYRWIYLLCFGFFPCFKSPLQWEGDRERTFPYSKYVVWLCGLQCLNGTRCMHKCLNHLQWYQIAWYCCDWFFLIFFCLNKQSLQSWRHVISPRQHYSVNILLI